MIAPFFRVFPSPATLLVVQALLAAVSVFPVSQAARREAPGPGPAGPIAVAYGFSWGLQQMVDFDFHEIAFAVPLLAFSLSALVRGRIGPRSGGRCRWSSSRRTRASRVAAIGLYLAIAGMRAAAREPDARESAAPGACRHVRGSRRQAAHQSGPDPLFWGFAWSFLAIGVIIPHFNPAHQYDYWSDGGILAPGGHPTVAGLIGQFFHAWPDKLQTIVILLLPTAFIALRSPLVLIAGPSLLLRFLSTNAASGERTGTTTPP